MICLKANEANTECIAEPPADELLDPGDVIKKVDGRPVDDPRRPAADPGEGEARRDDPHQLEREGEPMSGDRDDPGARAKIQPRTIIGFSPIDTTTVDLPDGLNVDIDTDAIGGPSAGLAFTLTLIDQLTEGDLMGGGAVAVTGEIDIDGNVGRDRWPELEGVRRRSRWASSTSWFR